MKIEIETQGEKTDHGWRDVDGFVGPRRPGEGPRTDPRGDFPTGPEIGEPLPNVSCLGSDGQPFDLHAAREGHSAILVFFRSAVW